MIWKTDPSEIERTYNIRKQQTQLASWPFKREIVYIL